MDRTTLLGLIVAFGAIGLSVMLEGGRAESFVNIPAGILVLGGTIGATVVGLPWRQVADVPRVLKQAFLGRQVDSLEVMELMTGFIRRARRDGILALDADVESLDNEFLRTGLQLVIDGTSQELLREMLETEVRAMRARHSMGQNIFGTLGGFAPTLGIIGTVMGLVYMLANLERPEEMGHSIASAFIATLYGVASANLVFLPIANKLKAKSEEELAAYYLAIEGLLALQAGESPWVAAARMRSFLPPRAKEKLDSAHGAVPVSAGQGEAGQQGRVVSDEP